MAVYSKRGMACNRRASVGCILNAPRRGASALQRADLGFISPNRLAIAFAPSLQAECCAYISLAVRLAYWDKVLYCFITFVLGLI